MERLAQILSYQCSCWRASAYVGGQNLPASDVIYQEAVFTIQQVAQQTGLSIDTLRYYERIKLIEPVKRTANGHRQYRQTDLDWINLIMRLRETGMPLEQISYFAQLRRQGRQTTTERRLILEGHQRLLEQQQRLVLHMEALTEEIECYKEREGMLAASSSACALRAKPC